jgi:hypothetical protein
LASATETSLKGFLRQLPDPFGHGRGLIFDVAHHGSRSNNEQSAQVSITLLGDAAKSGFATGRMLLRGQPEPSGELPTRRELFGIRDRCCNSSGCNDAKAGIMASLTGLALGVPNSELLVQFRNLGVNRP